MVFKHSHDVQALQLGRKNRERRLGRVIVSSALEIVRIPPIRNVDVNGKTKAHMEYLESCQ